MTTNDEGLRPEHEAFLTLLALKADAEENGRKIPLASYPSHLYGLQPGNVHQAWIEMGYMLLKVIAEQWEVDPVTALQALMPTIRGTPGP